MPESISLTGGRCRQVAFVIAAGAAAVLFAFLALPTIDFDEGYFFQAGVQALQTGKPGFPWADAVYGAPHLYIPLNSLDPLLNWQLAYLPQQWWLPAGRSISAVAVSLAVVMLLVFQGAARPGWLRLAVCFFVATCLPLLLIGRVIRPDGISFLGVCAALMLAFRPGRAAPFITGLVIALVVLAHVVHGVLATAIVFGMIAWSPAASAGLRARRLLLYGCGVALPVMLFYGVYGLIESPATIWRDASGLLAAAPRSVSSLSPVENIVAWAGYISGQANVWPLLLFAGLAVSVPSGALAPERAVIRFLKAVILCLLLFWIFLYPKKSYSIVVLLLPVAGIVLLSSRAAVWPVVARWGLVLCVAANTALALRYHWRLLHEPAAYAQLAPIVAELDRQNVNRPQAAIMGKLWLVFALRPDVTLWDITVFPSKLDRPSGSRHGIDAAIRRSDAVVLERQEGGWIDNQQTEIAKHLAQAGWRQVSVRTVRYFQPLEARIFLPP